MNDIAMLAFIAVLINYWTLYKKNKIIGSIMFTVIGVATAQIVQTLNPFAPIIAIIGVANTVYCIFSKTK